MDKDSVTTIFNRLISDVTDVLGNIGSGDEEEMRLKSREEMNSSSFPNWTLIRQSSGQGPTSGTR
jgi:hypothetical protein